VEHAVYFYAKHTENLNIIELTKSGLGHQEKYSVKQNVNRRADNWNSTSGNSVGHKLQTIYSLQLQQHDGWFLLRHYGHSFRCLPFIKCHPDELISQVFQCLHLTVTHRSFTFELKEQQAKGNAYNSLVSFWLDSESGRRHVQCSNCTVTGEIPCHHRLTHRLGHFASSTRYSHRPKTEELPLYFISWLRSAWVFQPEHGNIRVRRNVGTHLPIYTALHPRRQES
jgi:hypothetical protein